MVNSEMLYLYDAKLTNTNGDPDEENRPRMIDNQNIVTDLRLKRYIRDYFMEKGHELYVQKVDGESVTAEKRVADKELKTEDQVLDSFADVRLFGATMPIKNNNMHFTGPVQFNWGYSLNDVELIEASITSQFASSESKKQGAIGKDYRVRYSFLAFSGVISAHRAEHTKLREEDVILMDEAMKYAIPLQVTRSKIGQYPRLYLRVEYNNAETILGDLRDYIVLKNKKDLSGIQDVELEMADLVQLLTNNKEKIQKIYYYCNSQLNLMFRGEKKEIGEMLKEFELCEIR
ncbi:type I-B CRISPR-associated protein Cas7/Csh2 [Anaerostipes sp.]|uniref:type I-B CRISPR-associated protein Cas7/Csh2 n=1 Tax=Anaerostipes sp. TaxID=1872530 RepID=UPI0025BE7DE8|nr:type I-B CRISPR-associated protein Cas7/Csh2 [Anaerostipes sp.]MBS7006812.1 type I-B CRISPR-associated protein Cas7/Csh2 [Anaerostipes sp.]